MRHDFTVGASANRATTFLDNDQLRSLAPSIFAEDPHESRSDRYQYIPTIGIVEEMRAEGFFPVKVTCARVRAVADQTREGFQKHMIRFRRSEQGLAVGDVFPEVVLVNSHDGSSAYNLMAGLHRLVCSNGLVVCDSELSATRVTHKGHDVIEDVIEGSYRVLSQSNLALEKSQEWGLIELNPMEQQALAISAHHVRFADSEGVVATPIKVEQLLLPRRNEDRKNDLWTIFNRIQENAVKGGLSAYGAGSNGRRRRTTSKEVKGIDGNVSLNKALWLLADCLASARK